MHLWFAGVNDLKLGKTALLSQEGSGIAKRIPRGVVPEPKRCGYGTTPRVVFDHAALLTQEGSTFLYKSFTFLKLSMEEKIV